MNIKPSKHSMVNITIRYSNPDDSEHIIKLWHDTVIATHHFLSKQDFDQIYQEVSSFIPQARITLALDQHDKIVGFMMLNKNHIEALFVDHTLRKQKIGYQLIHQVLLNFSIITTTVNEQNIQALQFYKHLGFKQTHRTECDQQNRPYPLLYLQYNPHE